MKLFKVTKSAVLLASLYSAMSIGITLPAPPPELPDTLTKFRTLEQLNEDRTQDNSAYVPFTENVEIESAPFVPGDDSAGIVRIASIYTPEATDRVTSLGDIAMYTDADEVPLWEVLDSVSKKEEGKPSSFNYKKAPAAELHDYFAEVLPNYDRDRVHDSDIKKLLQWYNILAKYGITDFKATLAPTEGENVDDRAEQVAE